MTPTVIITRPAAQAAGFAADLRAAGAIAAQIIVAPLILISPVQLAVDPADYQGVVLTSAHGVAAARRLGVAPGTPAWCVGAQTAALAKAAGLAGVAGPGDAAGLCHMLQKAGPAGPLLHLHGRHTRGDIATTLTKAGIRCDGLVAYDQHPQDLSPAARCAVDGANPVIFPLFSPRSSTILSQQAPFTAPVHLVTMSAAVSDAAKGLGAVSVTQASAPDAAAMTVATMAVLGALLEGPGTAS